MKGLHTLIISSADAGNEHTYTHSIVTTFRYSTQEPLKPRTNVSCRFLKNQLAISF
jgi:hypothetical protein